MGVCNKKSTDIVNSYIEQDSHEIKVLLIVPHPDDEINLAGATIKHFTEQGAQVFCVYTTNGDYAYSAAVRLREACNALACMGVPKKNIYCLGYGDTPNWKGLKHIFASWDEQVMSPAGNCETYGAVGIDDYVFKKTGHHHSYCWNNFKEDLKQVLLEIRADIIIGIDLDAHQDHRFCSLILDELMGEILTQHHDYKPVMLKGFAYGTAFDAVEDFYRANLLSTVKPEVGQSINLNYDVHALSIYNWEERVRCPVPATCRSRFLVNNAMFKALSCHKSQMAGWRAERIINGDQVFWQRRTDSLLYGATLVASSGDGELVRDFKLWDSTNLDLAILPLSGYLWQPDEQDLVKSIEFTWHTPQKISLLYLYGSINDDNSVLGGELVFNHSERMAFGPLPANGAPLKLEAAETKMVTSLIVRLTKWEGRPGLAQIEAFADLKQTYVLQPWLKIMVQENFIYDYWLHQEQESVELGVYCCNYTGKYRLFIVEGNNCRLEGQKLYFAGSRAKVVLRVEAEADKSIFDQVVIYRKNKENFAKLKKQQKFDQQLTCIYLRFWRKYMVLRKRWGHMCHKGEIHRDYGRENE